MEQQIKQRLVGVIVLTALAVIFLPLLFEDAQEYQPGSNLDIPEKPSGFESQVVELPEYPLKDVHPRDDESHGDAVSTQSVSSVVTPVVSSPTPAARETTDENKKDDSSSAAVSQTPSELSAWVIQLGSFRNRAYADSFSDKVRKNDFAAFVEVVKDRQGKTLYRVMVGPEIEKTKAETMEKKLQKLFKVNTLLLSYGG